jgi:glycosyltransferase involved in cell wall biosynthesis
VSQPQPLLTAAVLARDEAAVLADCLASLAFADEVLVLIDSDTRDETRSIARRYSARVEERRFDTFAAQRDAALQLARCEWVLFVDADERVTPALRESVLSAIASPGGRNGFWIPRLNYMLGRVVRHAGWYPDYQLRLLRRESAHYDRVRVVHEVPIVAGEVGHLQQPFVHLNYRTLAEFVRKQERYCRLDAQRWLLAYGQPRRRAVIGQPLREFWRRYVTLAGYREGLLGLLLSALLGWYAGKSVWLARSADGSSQLGHTGDRSHPKQEVG